VAERAGAIGRVALAVLVGGWIALGEVVVPRPLGYATLAAAAFTAAGLAARPGRGTGTRDLTVFAGTVIGVVGAALVSGLALLTGVLALVGVVAQSRARERHRPLRDLVRAVLAGLPLMFGALAVDRTAAGIVPWTLVAWAQLIRERAANLGAEGSHSRAALLPALLALGFVPLSLVLPVRAGYGGAYFLVAMFAQLALLVAAARLIVGRMDGVRTLLEGALVISVLALLGGRII
jgi:hypothetical protein